MSRNLALWVDHAYQNDQVFHEDSPMNRDDCLAFFRCLKRAYEKITNGKCHTQDYYVKCGENPSIVLFFDIPNINKKSVFSSYGWNNIQSMVILQENEVIQPRNWELFRHAEFDRLFTWHDGFLDNDKYYRWNYSIHVDHSKLTWDGTRTGFCTMIAGNKQIDHPLSLYGERIKAIRWYELNCPEKFDLYGMGWNEAPVSNSLAGRLIRRLPMFHRLFCNGYPSYCGPVFSKNEVLQKYRFAFCYENAKGFPGYITEKLLDCLYAGCIPIYWGAPNIKQYVPEECIIEREHFKDYWELNLYLESMSDAEYEKKREAIRQFLLGKSFEPFSSEFVAESVAWNLVNQ